jgi:rhodanese-related sulfurtransferase
MPDRADAVIPLSATELKQRLDRGEALVVLDVREDDERAYCAIPVPPTAADLHIPLSRLGPRIEEIQRLVADRPSVVYCHHGIRSLAVAGYLAERGASRIYNLDGGIEAWSTSVDPGVPRY